MTLISLQKKFQVGGLTDEIRVVLLKPLGLKTCERMSENENLPPAPSKQTSSVPLKKETVRVTLKAADAPPAVPSATVPVAPPVRPPVPTAPPTATGGPPRPPAPAPTIPLRPAGAPTAMAPAPTIRLASAAPTSALRPPGSGPAPTMALPKATVQLQPPTQPLGTSFSSPSQMATTQVDDDDESEAGEGLAKVLSGVGLLAALVVLAFQLMTADSWINVEDAQSQGDWMKLLE